MTPAVLARAEIQSNGFSHSDKLKFLELFEQHKNPFVACQLVGISPTTYYLHQYQDSWFADQVAIRKKALAYSLMPRQFERAMGNSTTDSIWLQKVLGGTEFNPESRHTVELSVNLPLLTHRADGLTLDVPLTTPPTLVMTASAPTEQPTTTPPVSPGGQGSRQCGERETYTSLTPPHNLAGQKGSPNTLPVIPSMSEVNNLRVIPGRTHDSKRMRYARQGRQKRPQKYAVGYKVVKIERPLCLIHPGVRHYKMCMGERQAMGSVWLKKQKVLRQQQEEAAHGQTV